MAHVTLHFSLGIVLAAACMARRGAAAWREGLPVSGLLGRGLIVSWCVGLYACIPSLLRQAGLPDVVCDGWWMNVFVGYPLIKRVFSFGGMPLGVLALGCTVGAQYALLVAAIRRASHVELADEKRVV